MNNFLGTHVAPMIATDVVMENGHAGISFEKSAIGTIDSNSSYTILGISGDLPPHFHGFDISVSAGPVTIELIEAPEVTVSGSTVPSFNKNRNSTNIADMEVKAGATVTDGTGISINAIHDVGGGAHTVGGQGSINSGWILKPNTVYAIKITTGTIVGGISYAASFFWSEPHHQH